MPGPSDNFIDSLVQDLKPVRRLRPRTAVGFTLAALVVAMALPAAFLALREDILGGNLTPMFMLTSGLFLVLAVAASYTVIDMARPLVGNRHDGWAWAAAAVALLPAGACLKALFTWLRGAELVIHADGVLCLTVGTSLAVLLGAVLTFWLRRGAPTSPERAGLLTGVAAGSMGMFAFGLYCASDDLMHVGVWHVLVVIVSAGLGRMIVPRLIRW